MDDKSQLRARDFWASLGLISLSGFFIWQTTSIPLQATRVAGVSSVQFYDSAAVVPFFIFGALLILSLILLANSIASGGAARALSGAGIGLDGAEIWRIGTIAAAMAAYILGLVPRVDFIIASGLLITALIWGYSTGQAGRMGLAAGAVLLAGSYALIRHLPQSEWNKPHDDDWVALAIWILLTAWALTRPDRNRLTRAMPLIAVIAPLILVTAMAFGFRQNVPNRGGLIFSQIERTYYLDLRPLWSQ